MCNRKTGKIFESWMGICTLFPELTHNQTAAIDEATFYKSVQEDIAKAKTLLY